MKMEKLNRFTVPAATVQSYWLQSQEQDINRQCLSYSPSWATHASFVAGVDELEVASAVSDFLSLSVCHVFRLSLALTFLLCEVGTMMEITLKEGPIISGESSFSTVVVAQLEQGTQKVVQCFKSNFKLN